MVAELNQLGIKTINGGRWSLIQAQKLLAIFSRDGRINNRV